MFIVFLASMLLVSAGIDLYLYRAYAVRVPIRQRYGVMMAVAAFAAVDLLFVATLVSAYYAPRFNSQGQVWTMMWVVFAFFLSFSSRFFFVLVSAPGVLFSKRGTPARRVFDCVAFVAAGTVAALMLKGALYDRNNLVVKEIVITSDKLPASFDGFRVVFFSDVHLGNMPPRSRLAERMVERINSLDADVVVNGGDLVNMYDGELTPKMMEILSGLKAVHGVYSVEGNHDMGTYIKDTSYSARSLSSLLNKQRRMGWNMLLDSTVYLHRGGDSISLSGVRYASGRWFDEMPDDNLDQCYAGVNDSLFNMLVAHTPTIWGAVRAKGRSDLMLSGHIHSMQMKFRLFGWEWSPARLRYPEWSGLYEKDGRRLYINDGIGCVLYPMRIAVPPEITLIVLKSSSGSF